jgi:hypothetical protein
MGWDGAGFLLMIVLRSVLAPRIASRFHNVLLLVSQHGTKL